MYFADLQMQNGRSPPYTYFPGTARQNKYC
ncbi:hypothetical protein EV199_4522 [Pseudobacter ginsenosidimutans]|uniref:Uncharacterized protein n=1 Tax=Pseudobacter ginsenosidimutans TaxID=661488 RepID=A0A4V2F170_9BACT|nr:hypothetical protein EV199_4522 [Pseudobacter ginsenosidimutans]